MLELLNRYAHGLASIPLLHALKERGCLAYLEEVGTFSSEQMARELSANQGSLEVALRMLVCLDWLRPAQAGHYTVTPELAHLRAIPDQIMDLYGFPFDAWVQGSAGQSLEPWLEQSEKSWNSDHPLLPDFLDGLLVVPVLLALKTQGRLSVSEALHLNVSPAVRSDVARLFVSKGWASQSAGALQLSRAGRYIIDRIFITAALASYRPMFLRAQELLFGDAAGVFSLDAAGHETHLDRTLNVLGSGFQHEKYFAALSEQVVRLFDHESYSAQPKYIADTGSGDGSLLRRLYETVRDRTRRGKVLDLHPLIPIAVDFHEKALAAASQTLQGIEHVALKGDIGDPAGLLRDLRAQGVEDVERILHVRSFLDHDRPYREPEDRAQAARRSRFASSGIYLDTRGGIIPPGEMIQSTVEHLRRWSHLVNEHGLIILEVHCLPAPVVGKFLDESESFHFDAYQSLSRQYLLEPETFLACAAEAGLFCRDGCGTGFPKHLPFTRITLNHFEKRPYAIRHACEEDLPALLALQQEAARAIEAGLRELPEGQLVLESAGRILAAVSCRRSADAVRVVSVDLLPGGERSHVQDLLRFVEQYWALKSDAGRLAGIEEHGSALAGGVAEPSRAVSVARDVGARAAGYPFDAQDDPRSAERELGELSFRWLLAILQRMGVMQDAGETYELDQLKRRLGVVSKYDRYFEALVRRLEKEEFWTLDGRSLKTTELVRHRALTAAEEEVAAFTASFTSRYPGCAGLLNLTACCLSRYEEILTGRVEIADVLFQDGDMEVFDAAFRGDGASKYFNHLVAEAVRSTVARSRDKVRIIEIGAGTGVATAAILEALQPSPGSAELCVTDISQSFLRYARRRFAGQHPWVEYRALNIEKDPSGQGFKAGSFDIAVAANVLHDTRDIEHTLEQARRLLKPGGLLVLNELTSVKDCLFFSGALLHGYWLFEDPDRRLRDSCLLSVPQWGRALERAGFSLVESFVLPTQAEGPECSQSVMLCEAAGAAAPAAVAEQRPPEEIGLLGRQVEQDILALLGEERASAYSAQRPLMEMGLDSIELVELKSLLRGRFGLKLPPAFLFEHETQEKITKALAAKVSGEQLRARPPQEPARELPRAEPAGRREAGEGTVAVVGIACRFSGGANSPETFWKLLERGGHGIGPLPAGRWQWPAFIDLEGAHKGIDQGGFLARIDEFDARFFRTSPREAEMMDPQQRLLLELSWETLEDAGHRPSELSGRKVGVFVGVCQSDYRDVLVAADAVEAYVGSGTAFSMLANRLSYFFDFKGPSVTVDTACSSSLVALHDAMTALRRGECEQALVGAVNLLCSPTISVSYYQAGMLSPTGRCRTFDAGADGYVRGEGGAMLLLKPLARAIEDGDSIYGLVRGTAVNHGGQAMTLTAPKPDAQAEVVERAWQEAGLAADTVGCVEAHGTGTPLGDPIEVSGLTEAFRRLYRAQGKSWPAQPLCGLGSVKSNLGHLEGAAGLAGLMKILLSMQHRQIPRTLHFQRLNPEIDLAGSPFHVVGRNEAWPCFRDAQGRELPRRAGVSSFGFGGANAHAVLEEHRDPGAGRGTHPAADGGPFLIPLSARSQEELAERARGLLAFLERLDHQGGEPGDGPSDRVQGTLQGILTSRFGLEEPVPDLEWEELSWSATESLLFLAAVEEELGLRLHSSSLVAYPSLGALTEHVVQSRAGGASARSLAARSGPAWTLADIAWTLQVGREPMSERVAFLAGTQQELVAALGRFVAGDLDAPGCHRGFVQPPQDRPGEPPAGADPATLASLWVQGVDVDWGRLSAARRRVHLPTYPFARERHWVSSRAGRRASPMRRGRPAPHPMLSQRGSLPEHRFDTVLRGDEPFLADHVIEGRPMLPAVAYLEMARAAAERVAGPSPAEDGAALWLGSVVWLRPLRLDASPVRMSLRLTGEEDGAGWSFEVYSDTDAAGQEPVFHMQGRVGIGAAETPPALGVAALRARCTRARYTGDDCYRALAAMGYEYGPGQRAIEELFVGDGEILARLRLPAFLAETRDSMPLHPAMADAAIQATFGFSLEEGRPAEGAARPALPFELSRAEIFRACSSTMWASIVRTGRPSGGSAADTFGIDLCDEAGRLCARFQGLTLRAASSRPAGAPLSGEMLLMPVWEPVPVATRESLGLSAGPVMIVGGTEEQQAALASHPEARPAALEPGDSIDDLRAKIAAWGEVGHLVWIVSHHPPGSPADESLLAGREGGALFGFRLIKALQAEGYSDKPLTWSIATTEAQAVHADEPASPAHAAVHGLIGTMAKEHPCWQVRLVDLPSAGEWPWRDLVALAPDPHGNAWAWRDRRWYRQQLAPYRPAAAESPSPYRPGGVYVVIGGAGGIGEAWSEAVLRRVPARLVWIGRRPHDESIQARIDRLATFGPAPLYIAADATDRGELEAARDTILREVGQIDGVIHSAMVLRDKSLANMTEAEFLTGLSPKVDICVRLAQVFAGEPLDFILFFSSVGSFLKWPGQCNYAAGGAFEDAFASRLAAAWPCRVRVINWGYWSVGALDSEPYRTIMARKGLAPVELPGAMRALDLLLAGPVRQLAYLEALGPQALEGASVRSAAWTVDEEETRRAEREKLATEAARITMGMLVRDARLPVTPREITAGQLTADLRLRVAQILGVDMSILDAPSRPFTGALLGEFGMDSLSSNSLRNILRRELGVDLPVHLILGEKVENIVGALYEQLLLQQVSQEPRHQIDEETETFVF